MLAWLISISVFWSATALYLGGMNVEIEGGGGVRQTLGLLLTFALFLVAWSVLRRVLGDVGPIVGGMILPTAICVLAIPLFARLGFLPLGVKVHRGQPHAAHH